MFGLRGTAQPFSTSIGPWRISEIYKPDVHKDVRPGLGSYSVVLEADVETIEELLDLHAAGVTFCEEFEPAWLYVWSTPLHGFGWGRHIERLRPPKGWSTNYDELHRSLHLEKWSVYGEMSIQSRHWMFGPSLPLQRALRVREEIAASDEVLQALVRFHYQAHTAGNIEGSVFFLCKGFEIAREMLPGKSTKKDRNLPDHVRNKLRQPLHQLFGVANYRLETRHALRTKGDSPSLHPSLGSDLRAFVEDVDLILRTVACMKLGEQHVAMENDK